MKNDNNNSPYTSAEDIADEVSSLSFSNNSNPASANPSNQTSVSSSKDATLNNDEPKKFQLHSLLVADDDDDEESNDVKLLRKNFFSKPNSGASKKLKDDNINVNIANNEEDKVTVLPSIDSNISLDENSERRALRASTERQVKPNSKDRIRLQKNIPIRPEDKIVEGPHVSYDDEVTVRGGGNEVYPDTNVTLETLGLLEEIITNLKSMGIKRLKRIQENIIPLILHGKQDIVAYARTGHGKTMSYLIPLINTLVLQNRRDPSTGRKPSVAILLQNHETAVQVYQIANKISQGLDLHIIPAIGSNNMASELERLRHEGGDCVIGTTGRFIQYISEKKIPLEDIKTIVFDEADLFLKDTEWEKSMKIFRHHMPYFRRTFLFSATYDDQSSLNYYSFVKHNCWFVAVGELNQVENLVRQTFIVDKTIMHDKILIKLLINKARNGQCPKTLVFTNSMDKADWVAGRLRMFTDIPSEFEIRAASLHSAVPVKDRDLIFKAFLLPFENSASLDVIVASDKISCGVSTPAELVINYDIPFDVSTYILRVGRTGRNGHSGEAYTFINLEQIDNFGYDYRVKLCSMLLAAKRTDHSAFPEILETFYEKNKPKN